MSPHRVLIVEDQREVSRLLRSALETLEGDLEVVEIPSGEEAILYSSRNKVDLLVSDYRLPGMTGIELMHKVQKNHSQARIILVTGQTDPRIRKEVAEAGANAFFIKPVPIADFLDSVERHLNLVETFLPPEPIAGDEPEPRLGLSDLLAGLRHELAATAVILLDDAGQILARAGDLPDRDIENSLISSLLSIHNAGQKVSRLVGLKKASNWCVFDGDEDDLIFAPVGLAYAMFVIGKGIADEDRVMKTVDSFSAARKNIQKVISGMGQGPSASREPVSPPLEVAEQGMNGLEPWLKDAKKQLKAADVNEFWNKAANNHIAPTKPDMLSYEQARQLGLVPEDKS
jgi:CheY-like chemotaxis protein